jgi:protein TonB
MEPKRSFFIWSGAEDELTKLDERAAADPPCIAPENIAEANKTAYVDSGEFIKRATVRQTQKYPAVAKAARASGTVVVEALVDEKGYVRCARGISGHPLMRRAAINAALEWKFTPLEEFGHPTRMIGRIAFHFRLP